MRLVLAGSFAVLTAGCGSTMQVMSSGPDTYYVITSSVLGLGVSEEDKALAEAAAVDRCRRDGMRMQVTSIASRTRDYGSARGAASTLHFRCVP